MMSEEETTGDGKIERDGLAGDRKNTQLDG